MQPFQIIYVVIFDNSNYCFEQAVLSICSLRMHNPKMNVWIVTDHDSASLITGWRKKLLDEYHCFVVPMDVPENFNKVERSRYLKTKMRLYVDGDFLFLDTDTIVCRPLDDLFQIEGDICAVLDSHLLLDENQKIRTENFRFKLAGIDTSHDNEYFNSGVLLVRNTYMAKAFYESWFRQWWELSKKKVHYDQLSLYLTNRKFGHLIQRMDGEWNCQLGGNFLKYLADAYIIHYYASSNSQHQPFYLFKDVETYKEVRKHGKVTDALMEALRKPRLQFNNQYVLMSGSDLSDFERSKACFDLCQESPRRFWLVDKLARWLKKTYSR